ncbi:lytic polysaccharide monooxygenase [Hyalangium versicolor]|uniref:lytic polysaccharide monooxygenase n=1 Tax=Hyalangium versicolor TaxID=2861190 RepID=UPI001CCAD41D|nr:lytic polysaccharide monooxygenase [Hyalangium versicolor]
MKKHLSGSLAVLSLLSAGSSFAHGSLEVPVSRVYNCYKEGPENPKTAACKAAVAAGGTQALYDWNGVRRGEANGQHQQQIPDGKLCSANNELFKGLDLPRTDWAARLIAPNANGRFDFIYYATAPHASRYHRFYVTKSGYNPALPLKWSDLESTPFCEVASVPLQNNRYTVNCPWPAGKQGRHVIYHIWQRSDSPEAFYACTDVDFGSAALQATEWKELEQQVQAHEALPAGSRVTFRVFDRDGRDAELHDLLLTEELTPAESWLVRLARQVNASSRYVRVGTLGAKGEIAPMESAQGNSVYVREDGYRFQIDVEKPAPTPDCKH